MRLLSLITASASALLLSASSVLASPSSDSILATRQLQGTLSLDSTKELFTFKYSTPTPGAKNWIGVYRASGGGPVKEEYVSPSLIWAYAPEAEGTLFLSASALDPGLYQVFLLANDGYKHLASPINVTLAPNTGKPLAFVAPAGTLRNARQGDAYSAPISGLVSGGSGTITFSRGTTTDGWASVSPEGIISGTPNANSTTTTLSVIATDTSSQTATITITIPVRPAGLPLVKRLGVLSFNTWGGGRQVSSPHEKLVRFLLTSGADVAGLQEDEAGHSAALAEALGWYRWASGRSVSIISRYPIVKDLGIVDKDRGSGGVRIALDGERQQISFWSAHYTAYPYGPYVPCREGGGVERILEVEREGQRERQATELVAAMAGELAGADKVPVLLTGDFNAPSHRDYTEALREKNCGVANVPWPTSVKPEEAGLIDSFRVAHPDPAAVQGTTWSPIYPFANGATGEPEPQDRIDFVLHKGPLKVVSSEVVVVGEPKPVPNHKENEWTSDHAAVLTVYRLQTECVPRK